MRRLINLDQKKDLGVIDWEFIHEMQGIVPDLIKFDQLKLTKEFLKNIPSRWEEISRKLKNDLKGKDHIHFALSDIENRGNEFKLTGRLVDEEINPLDFYKVQIFDQDKWEDDYMGSVLTDGNGEFSLLFGKAVFSDFLGLEAMPDIYFKIFAWNGKDFELYRKKIMPTPHEVTKTSLDKTLIAFGTIIVKQ